MRCTVSDFLHIRQGSGTYDLRGTRGSFDDGILLAWHFDNMLVTDETFTVIFLQSHQQHHTASEVAINSKKHVIKEKIQTFTIV